MCAVTSGTPEEVEGVSEIPPTDVEGIPEKVSISIFVYLNDVNVCGCMRGGGAEWGLGGRGLFLQFKHVQRSEHILFFILQGQEKMQPFKTFAFEGRFGGSASWSFRWGLHNT